MVNRREAVAVEQTMLIRRAGRLRSWWLGVITGGTVAAQVALSKKGIVYTTAITRFCDKNAYTWRLHEATHICQMRQDGLIKFACKYAWQFITGLLKHKSIAQAYYCIDYEVEAREMENGK